MQINFGDKSMIVADESVRDCLKSAERAAASDSPVLICGPSGTGKELIARFIHEQSERKSEPFVSVNCAAIPEGLLESELFGHERGAFTGAHARREGKFELASSGTLLLDEISEMPFVLQAKLLRVLQEKEIDRLGGKHPIRINTRVIATTNREPTQLLSEKQFRQDLYYRLNVMRLNCRPLQGRYQAIRSLSESFLLDACGRAGLSLPEMSDEAWKKLFNYGWPGNIRELQNVIERAVWLSPSNQTVMDEALLEVGNSATGSAGGFLSLHELEREQIAKVLDHTDGNRTRAAQILGINVRTLRNKLKEYSV